MNDLHRAVAALAQGMSQASSQDITEELKDLKKIYEENLKRITNKINYIEPTFLHCMQEMLDLRKEQTETKDKLDILKKKIPDDSDDNKTDC